MTVMIIVRIAIWATFFLLIIDGVLLSLLIPRELHFIKKRLKAIEDWIKKHGEPH